MGPTDYFPDRLPLIADRAAAMRAAVANTPDPAARVPGCPDWSVRDLVTHVGEVHRSWAAVVSAGPSAEPPSADAVGDTTPHGDLLAWSAESTNVLLAALEAAGDPDRGCWTWWGAAGAPSTVGAVARHQVQEAAVHAYDAQEAAGHPEPLPRDVAIDGIGEFIEVSHGSSGAWPHPPARVALHADEGSRWVIDLGADGARAAGESTDPDAVVRASASDLLLLLYGRIPLERAQVEGDRTLAERLFDWPSLG